MTDISLTGLTRDQEIDVVNDIRFLIVERDGMATEVVVGKILMAHFGLEEYQARDMTNTAQYANRKCFQVCPLKWSATRPRPKIEDWPGMLDFQPERKYRTNERGAFRLRRQFHEITLIYRKHTMLPEDAVLIATAYAFLVPMNTVFTAAQLATAMRQYSDHERTDYLASILENIARKEQG